MSKITFEICVDTPQGLLNAKAGGADRVELCSALVAGGLTPSRALMRFAAAQSMPAHVMIRPREGDFCFDEADVQLMLDEISLAQQENMRGVVLGATRKDGTLDLEILEKLVAAANGMDITLHRAFDVTPDPFVALEDAISLGFNRILTSGQQKTAFEGKDLIAQLAEKAGDRIEIMPGSGVNAENVKDLSAIMNLTSVHASCAVAVSQSPKAAEMLGFSAPDGRRETSAAVAQQMAEVLSKLEGVMQ